MNILYFDKPKELAQNLTILKIFLILDGVKP